MVLGTVGPPIPLQGSPLVRRGFYAATRLMCGEVWCVRGVVRCGVVWCGVVWWQTATDNPRVTLVGLLTYCSRKVNEFSNRSVTPSNNVGYS